MLVIHFIKITSVLILTLAAFSVSAQELEKTPQEITETFLADVISGNLDQAIERSFSPNLKQILGKNLNNVKTQVVEVFKVGGEFKGVEFVREEDLSKKVKRLVYFVYTENLPLAFSFYYYKTDGGWDLISFIFDTDLEDIAPLE